MNYYPAVTRRWETVKVGHVYRELWVYYAAWDHCETYEGRKLWPMNPPLSSARQVRDPTPDLFASMEGYKFNTRAEASAYLEGIR